MLCFLLFSRRHRGYKWRGPRRTGAATPYRHARPAEPPFRTVILGVFLWLFGGGWWGDGRPRRASVRCVRECARAVRGCLCARGSESVCLRAFFFFSKTFFR